jgi:ribonuclease BN (tRNA processing enzyme)
VRLTVLGSSGSYPAAGRPGSGYLLEQRGTRVWCDAGPGTFDALARTIDIDLVDAIVVSHRHADHCADLLAALHAWAYRPEPRLGVPLYAPISVFEALEAFLDADAGHDLHRVFDFHPVGDGSRADIGELDVRFVITDHSVPNVASRFSDGSRVFAFTGDTGPEGSWHPIVEGAHLLLCEATYQESDEEPEYPHHLTAAEAGRIAREGGVRELMITHIPPNLDPDRSVGEAERTFDRPVAIAVPGASHKV